MPGGEVVPGHLTKLIRDLNVVVYMEDGSDQNESEVNSR